MNRSRSSTSWVRWGLLLVLAGGVLVQSLPAAAQSSFAYRRYTANNSLPTNLTKSVVQDGSGRLWVGTDNGLVRFDGSEFTTVRGALRSPLVKDVYRTPDDRLLVVTDQGIHEVVRHRDSMSFPVLVEGGQSPTDSTVAYPKLAYQDRAGRLWIAGSNAIVRYDEGRLVRYVPEPKLSYWSERFSQTFLFGQTEGSPLVAAAQRGYVFAYDASADRFRRLSVPERPADIQISALIPNPQGDGLLLGTSRGLYGLEVDSTLAVRRWEKLNDLDAISALCPAPDGGVLLGTWGEGLYRTPDLETPPELYGTLPFRVIQDITTTQDQAVVLATDTGLGVIPRYFFRTVAPPRGETNRFIRDVTQGPDGTLWASRSVGAFSVDRSTRPFRPQLLSLETKEQLWSLAADAEGLWVGFQDGHLEYVRNGQRRRISLPETDVRLVRSLVVDGEGGVWALQDGVSGALHVDASFRVTHYGPERGAPGRLFTLYRTPDGTLYAGGRGGDRYLLRFDPARGRFVSASVPLPSSVPPTLRIQDLEAGPDGGLWLASSHGLLRYRDGEVTLVDALDLFDVRSVSAVAIDEQGLVWLGTNRGLFAYSPDTGALRRFNRQTGLPSPTISPRSLLVDDEGRLWAGTAQGLAYLRKSKPPFRKTPAPVVTKMWADNRTVQAPSDSVIRLPHNSTLEVGYAAPVFVQNGTLYRHRILGSGGAGWSPVSTNSPLVLPELSTGSYTLELKAQQPGFGWSTPTRVHFSVRPPWYLRWWALLSGGLFLLGLLGLLGLLYRQRRAQHEAERALYRSRKQYESVVENVEEAIFQLDREGHWTFLNPAWTEITGYAVDHSLGRPYHEFIHPEDQSTLADTIDALLAGEQERGRCQVRFEEPEGHAHWVEVRAQLLREEDGEVVGLTGLLVDIHERKQYEAQLIEAKERAEAARERAEEMNQLKTVFLANMGHELRTPLTSILGFARSLRDELPEPYPDLVRPILRSGQRLKRTFDSVLSLAQIEGDVLNLDREPVEVNELVGETLPFFRNRADQENLPLHFEESTEPVYAALDARAFDRVLSNLLSNALKFTEEGEVTVRVRRDNEQVVIQVEDTGIGISDSFQQEVFDEFKQESEGLTRSYEGSGLGLTIAKRLVEQMDGTIAIDSEKEVGTTVTVRFKVVEEPASVVPGGT